MEKQMKRFWILIVVGMMTLGFVSPVMAQSNRFDFSEIITEEAAHVPLLSEVYEDFYTIIEELDFKDLDDEEDEASTPEEVLEIADEVTGKEGQIVDLSNTEQLVAYMIQTDEEFDEGVFEEEESVTKDVEIGFYHKDGDLIGAIVTTANYALEESLFMDAENIGEWLDEQATISDIEVPDKSVFAYSVVEASDTMYSGLMVSTLDADGIYSFDNMLFAGEVLSASPYFYIDEFDSTFIDINLMNLISQVVPDFFEEPEEESQTETGESSPQESEDESVFMEEE